MSVFFFFSSRRRHTRLQGDWSSDVCSSDLLPEARDNQHQKMWRGMIGDLAQREDELGGKTLLVVGMGRIGSHLALLAKAFGMKVIGIRRDPSQGENGADSIYGMGDLVKLVPQADI